MPLPFIDLLYLGDLLQRAIPVGFQFVGDEAIRGIDLQVPAAGEIRLVACALDGAAMQPVGLVEPRLELLLDRQGDLQGQRRDGLEEHAPDRVIETAARDALTDRFGLRDPATLTDVRGPSGPLAAVIAHGHPIPTDPAHREPLEERGALARRTPSSVGPIRLRVLAEPALIVFEVLPGDVAGMRVRDQCRPLLARESLVDDPRLSRVALPGAPEKERAREAGIMEDPECARMLQPPPQCLALVGAEARPARKRELLIAE